MLSDQVLFDQIAEHFQVFVVTGLMSILTGGIAWREGFFKKPLSPLPNTTIWDVVKGFAAFLATQVILVPAFITVFFYLFSGPGFNATRIDKTVQGWMNLASILIGFVVIFSAFLTIPSDRRKQIWGDSKHGLKHLTIGALTWFISYPFVLAINQLISIGVLWLFRQPQIEQVAVKHIRNIATDSWLFGLTVLSVSVLVPIVEELLFRGLLQSWLHKKFKSIKWAIITTSFIFAFFHFSSSQSYTNIELLSSLFLLSCFLGFLYERQRSLWASIGLHSFFNAMSLLMITE